MGTATRTKRTYAPRMPLEQRRQQILDAAVDEFLEKGFAGARVDAIADAIGVSKPVLYGAYESKEAIAAAVVEEGHRREAVLNIEADNLDAYAMLGEGKVVPLYKNIFRIAAEHKPLFRFLYSDFRGASPEALAVHDEVFDQRTAGILWYMERFFSGRADGGETAVAASEMISALARHGLRRVAAGEVEDPQRLAELNGGLIEHGLANF